MLIPFNTERQVAGRVSSQSSFRASDHLKEWSDGSYVIGILNGTVVGATALSKGLRIVDFTDAEEVVTMLRDYLPADVRALVREQLLEVD